MIMTKSTIEPSDIGRHPNLIKTAQKEMTEVDVLVCGKCHAVYHHVEHFKEHKQRPCKLDSTLKDCRETKAKVWAFLLWKASQMSKTESSTNTVNSWKLYQEWIDLEEEVRDTWIVAGETIQTFAKMGQGNLQEAKSKDGSSIQVIQNRVIQKPTQPQFQQIRKTSETVTKTLPVPKLSPISSPLRQIQQRPGITIKRSEVPVSASPVKKHDPANLARMILNAQNKVFRAKHFDAEESSLKEYRVEKILAKRFNPRKRMHEYLVKWSTTELESNTWEPQNHLESCDPLLEIFETQLAKQKEARAKMQQNTFEQIKAAPQSTPRPVVGQRSVAINRVPEENKRKQLDSDYDTTTEDESSFDGKRLRTEGGRLVVRRQVNGAGRSPAAAEVVISNAKDGKTTGVVKKPGMSVSPKVAAEPAQVRIIAKGESTASGVVKIVQGAGGTKQIVRTSTPQRLPAPPPVKQMTRQIVTNNKATTQVGRTTVTRIVSRTGHETKTVTRVVPRGGAGSARKPSSEDEDGLADPFPKDIKTAPDSPERALTLCPVTGKVLGRAEGEKTPPADDEAAKAIEEALKQEQGVSNLEQQTANTEISQIMTNEDGSPLLVTGEDGTIYQVAGKNAEGQTILIAQGADGEQCVLLAADDGADGGLLASMAAGQEGVVVEEQTELKAEPADGEAQSAAEGQTGATQALTIQTDGEEGQITAEVVQAELPSPGGTRRVVLLLPDGSFVMTEVNDEQYQSLNLNLVN